jgi:3-oxoacyl-[acyl-carrier-protein] synthase-3
MMSQPVYISEIGYSLGNNRQNLEQSHAKGLTFSSAQLLTDSGFRFHHMCGGAQTTYDLARAAVDNLLSPRGKSLDNINGILYATCLSCNGNLGKWEDFRESGDVKHLMDFPVSHLQAEFGMQTAFLLGVNQTACTSLLSTLRIAKALMRAESHIDELLCLTADRFPQGAVYEQTYNLISDGAAACVVSRHEGRAKILDVHHISNGAMARANDDETAGFYFNYSYRVIDELLKRNDLSIKDINWIVPQNTNIKAWEVLASILRFDYERVLTPTREDIGHCISGDNIINLKKADDQGVFRPGDKILLPMAGFGLNWSCVLLEKV